MAAAIVIAALIVAGALVHPASAAGDLWTVAVLAVVADVILYTLGRGGR